MSHRLHREPHTGTRHNYRTGLPQPGHWAEILNADHAKFGGSNTFAGANTAEVTRRNDLDYSATLTLPPLGVLWLTHEPDSSPPAAQPPAG